MGVDAGDFDDDGDEDLFVTELTGEGRTSSSTTASGCSRTAARRRGWALPAWGSLASARRGSISTTMAGSISVGERRRAGDREPATGGRPPAPPPTQAAPAEPWRRPFRGRDRSRRRRAEPGRRLAEAPPLATSTTTATWTCLVGNNNGPTRLLSIGRNAALDRSAADRRRGARHVGRAVRGAASGRPFVVAASSCRRQLCLRQRSQGRGRIGRLADVRTARHMARSARSIHGRRSPSTLHDTEAGADEAPRLARVSLCCCARLQIAADQRGAPSRARLCRWPALFQTFRAPPSQCRNTLRPLQLVTGRPRSHSPASRAGECVWRDGKAVHGRRVFRSRRSLPGQRAAT